jgi:hypothetical protein
MCHRVLSGAPVNPRPPHNVSIKEKPFSCEINLKYSSSYVEYALPFPDTFSSSGILATKLCFILYARKFTTFAYTEDLQFYK